MTVERFDPSYYRDRRVLVTGGLGFIGSNLVHALVQEGARVTIIDAMTEGDGGNICNVDGVEGRIKTHRADIGDAELLKKILPNHELIFNLAGKVSHIDSVRDPLSDLQANTTSHLKLLIACLRDNPDIRIVYTGTRQIYGKSDTNVVTEESPIRPLDPNGISKFAADAYHRMFARDFGLKTAVLRLTNTYGPRQLMKHNRQGFIPWFVRQALDGEEIAIFGDGRQTRDTNFVDDVVDALLRVGASETLHGEVYNLGSDEQRSVLDIAQTIIRVAQSGTYAVKPFPDSLKKIDIGSIACDYSKFTAAFGWRPMTSFETGVRTMIEFYRTKKEKYWS